MKKIIIFALLSTISINSFSFLNNIKSMNKLEKVVAGTAAVIVVADQVDLATNPERQAAEAEKARLETEKIRIAQEQKEARIRAAQEKRAKEQAEYEAMIAKKKAEDPNYKTYDEQMNEKISGFFKSVATGQDPKDNVKDPIDYANMYKFDLSQKYKAQYFKVKKKNLATGDLNKIMDKHFDRQFIYSMQGKSIDQIQNIMDAKYYALEANI